MKRRELLQGAAALGFITAMPSAVGRLFASSSAVAAPTNANGKTSPARPNPLAPPAHGSIPVAFLLSDNAVVIDFCGPWEVFQDVNVPGRQEAAFQLYTVAETTKPIRASAGLKIVPDYTLANAPAPKVIVIPAQSDPSAAVLAWVRQASKSTDVTMSVCTGAFLLAKTGLLAGRAATTHHHGYQMFAMQFPDVHLQRGARFVEDGNLASAGGLSSGIDLALRVVERYYGREVAAKTADYMEYQGHGWLDPKANAAYAVAPASTDAHPLCPVCGMDADRATAPKTAYQGKTYYFCSQAHKDLFDASPARYLAAT
jgi:YHS domain-containing protein/putative intracellular protease/amidase